MEGRNAALLKRREERSKAPLPGCTFTPDVSISRRAAPSLASSATVKTTSEVQPESAQASSESPLELVVKDLHNNTKSAKAASERLYLESKERERRIEARLTKPVRQDCTFSPALISSSKKVPKTYVSPPNLPLQSQKSKNAVAAEVAAAAELTFSPAILRKSAKLVNDKNVIERLYDNSWTKLRKDETFNDADIRASQKFTFKPSIHSSTHTLSDKGKKVGQDVCSEEKNNPTIDEKREGDEDQRSEKKKRFELLYSRAMNAKLEREAMKLMVLERELEACSFVPDVSKSSQSARLIGIGTSSSSDPPFHTRLFENAEMRSERLRKMTAAALSAEEENLKGLFSPALSQRSRVLTKSSVSPRPRHEILYQQGVSRIASRADKSSSELMSEEDKKECTFSPLTFRSLTSSSEKVNEAGAAPQGSPTGKSVFEKLYLDAEARATMYSTPQANLPPPPPSSFRTYTGPITDVVRASLTN